jgi:hypothetical protein
VLLLYFNVCPKVEQRMVEEDLNIAKSLKIPKG